MHKVLVVDDELWIRKGIVQAIDWQTLGLELAGEAEDGDEAFELACREKPDIIVMDMRMPGMDGVELIRALNRSIPDTVIVVCSGFSDFEYTREAIVNRAFDYLLKPIKDEELNLAMEKAAAEARRRQSALRQASDLSANIAISRQTALKELLAGEKELGRAAFAGELEELLGAARIAVCVCGMERGSWPALGHGGAGKSNNAEDAGMPLKAAIGRHMASVGLSVELVADWAGNELVLLVGGGGEWNRSRLEAAVRGMLQASSEACPVPLSAGISELAEGGNSFQPNKAYKQALRALKTRRLSESSVVRSYEAHPPTGTAASAYPAEKENNLLYLLTMGNTREARKTFAEWLDHFRREDCTVLELQKGLTLLAGSIDKILNASSSGLEALCGKGGDALLREIAAVYDIGSADELLGSVVESAGDHFVRTNKKDGRKVIADIVRELNEHYPEPISLNLYARKYHLNPDYLSRLFKEETARNFSDFVTELRVDKAKLLLAKDANRNYEIANMVGYDDYRYFSQVFKKTTGMTLGEYREQFRQIRNSNTNK